MMSCYTSDHLTFLSVIGTAWSQNCQLAVNSGKIRFDFSVVFLDMIIHFSRGEGICWVFRGNELPCFVLFFFFLSICLANLSNHILLANSELMIFGPSVSNNPALSVLNRTCHSIKLHTQNINFHLYVLSFLFRRANDMHIQYIKALKWTTFPTSRTQIQIRI